MARIKREDLEFLLRKIVEAMEYYSMEDEEVERVVKIAQVNQFEVDGDMFLIDLTEEGPEDNSLWIMGSDPEWYKDD
jgi:hypothetical protein